MYIVHILCMLVCTVGSVCSVDSHILCMLVYTVDSVCSVGSANL